MILVALVVVVALLELVVMVVVVGVELQTGPRPASEGQ